VVEKKEVDYNYCCNSGEEVHSTSSKVLILHPENIGEKDKEEYLLLE
jgi:hypothetical protein